MNKFHISSNGEPGRCEASVKACPLGGESDHYSSEAEAYDAIAQQYGGSVPQAMHKLVAMQPNPGGEYELKPGNYVMIAGDSLKPEKSDALYSTGAFGKADQVGGFADGDDTVLIVTPGSEAIHNYPGDVLVPSHLASAYSDGTSSFNLTVDKGQAIGFYDDYDNGDFGITVNGSRQSIANG